MAVSIPISASAGGAVDAIRQIQQAIERAGQAGREFSKLDLSHPELAGFADDLRKISGRLQDLGRIGRGGTAAAYRSIQNASGGDFADPLSWAAGIDRAFPDPQQAARHRAAVMNYVTPGTRWSPPPPSGGGGGGFSGGGGISPGAGGAPQAPSGPGGIMGFMGGPIGLAISGGMLLAGAAKAMIGPAIQKAQEEATGNEDLYRHTDLSKSFDELREAARKASDGLQLTYQETNRLALTWAKLTGDNSPGAIMAGVRMGAGMGRAFGMDPGMTTQSLGHAVNLGLAPEKFAALVGEAAAKGGRSADETMPALLRLAEATTRTLVTHSNSLESASMLAGLNAMGLPGFRGANAEAIMNTLGSSISQGGLAGAGSAALSYMVGKRQGVTDPYDLKMLQEGGLFASAKSELGYGSSETNFSARLAELQRMYAGSPQSRLLNAMENDLGVNMRQGRELLRYKPADLSTTFTALQDAHVDLKTLNPSAIADVVRIANAGGGDLGGIRQEMLGRHGPGSLSSEDQRTLSDAGPGSLRGVLLQMAGKYGQATTEGTETREAMSGLSNAMTKVGEDLLKPLNDIKDLSALVVGGIGDIGTVLRDVYKAGRGDTEASDRLLHSGAGASVGGPETGITDAIKKARAAEAMAFFQSPAGGGYSKNQAAGIVAQVQSESDFQAHGPAGDGGMAVGAFQWHPDRRAAIAKRFGKRVEDMTFQEQMAAKAWELSSSGPEAAAGQALHDTSTAFGAGYSETVNDQRPALSAIEGLKRGQRAQTLATSSPASQVQGKVTVVHEDTRGNVLHTQELPVTNVQPPMPWGPSPQGQAGPRPPPPPMSRAASWVPLIAPY